MVEKEDYHILKNWKGMEEGSKLKLSLVQKKSIKLPKEKFL